MRHLVSLRQEAIAVPSFVFLFKDCCCVYLLALWVRACQVGVGHNFHALSTGFKWRISSKYAGASVGPSHITSKHKLNLMPGFAARVGLSAGYILPDMEG